MGQSSSQVQRNTRFSEAVTKTVQQPFKERDQTFPGPSVAGLKDLMNAREPREERDRYLEQRFLLLRSLVADNVYKQRPINALLQWTHKTGFSVLFNSQTEPFFAHNILYRTMLMSDIVYIVITAGGDVFGVYYEKPLGGLDIQVNDPSIFMFSFESHGRCAKVKRFALKSYRADDAFVMLHRNSRRIFTVGCGHAELSLYDTRTTSYTNNLSWMFWDMDNRTLTGHDGMNDPFGVEHIFVLHVSDSLTSPSYDNTLITVPSFFDMMELMSAT